MNPQKAPSSPSIKASAKTSPKTSLMSEAILWQLYRRLLGAQLLVQRLQAPGQRKLRQLLPSPAVAAAVTENLLTGDTLGLAPTDLITRYLCGVGLADLREAAHKRSPYRRADSGKAYDWALAADAEHGLLPAAGIEQASLAVGTSLAARLHGTGNITVLVHHGSAAGDDIAALWSGAVKAAAGLGFPLLFVSESQAGSPQDPSDPRKSSPALPTIPVDRHDTIALYRVVYESAARARNGGGPTWIDCRDPEVSRAGGDASKKSARASRAIHGGGALEQLEQVLRSRQLFDRNQQRQMERVLEKEFAQAEWPGRE